MSAVSQTYHNYLGGMNEQPDELKKSGQLVQADNVIPDPTIGLIRRPGFELIPQSKVSPGERDVNPDPEGTWFEMEFPNNVNDDYIYYGNVREDGNIVIYNQDGVKQAIRYTDKDLAVLPHKKYLYNSGKLEVLNDSDEVLQDLDVTDDTRNGYFRHTREEPLKYCVSKGHIIFTNQGELPSLNKPKKATEAEKKRYYSFMNLKLIDTSNYDYVFKVYGNDQVMETYNYVTEVETTKIDDVLSDYDKDTTLPLQTDGPWLFELGIAGENGIEETCEVEVEFRGQVVQLKSDDGDGYRNEARYNWNTQIITEGKGYQDGQVFQNVLPGVAGGPDLIFTFVVNEVKTVTEAVGSKVRPDVTGEMGADEILEALRSGFAANDRIDKALIVGNGIYLEGDDPFSISTAEIAVADVMNSQKVKDDVVPIVRVNTVGELPVECYAGFRVEVTNSFDDNNNYYLEYVAESQTRNENTIETKADGYWEEIAKPFEPHAPREGTLPHMITLAREADQPRFVFIVSPIKYSRRTAGTENDNPTMFRDNVRITSLNYYKNRLFFFTSGGTVISSQAGNIENLFLDTAVSTSAIDPIDVIANNNQRVPIYGSSVVNNGMVLFGDSEQYMLTTNSDILTSESVSVTKVANYTFDPLSNPIYLGANLGFISSGVSRFYEMTNLYERGPVDVNERSQQIQNVFGRGFNMPVSSREQSLVLVYKSGAVSRNLRVYKFRQESSQESSQTSWVRWQLDQPIAYVSMPRDKIYVFLKDEENGGCKIYRMNTINALSTSTPQYTDGYIGDIPGVPFLSRIEFPTIFAMAGEQADITANLTIHRLKLNTGDSGTYRMEIIREGYDDYVLEVEQTPAGKYRANTDPIYDHLQGDASPPKLDTFPVYTRNSNLRLLIKTNYDAPFTLKSMTWEGDYNRPYYKSV